MADSPAHPSATAPPPAQRFRSKRSRQDAPTAFFLAPIRPPEANHTFGCRNADQQGAPEDARTGYPKDRSRQKSGRDGDPGRKLKIRQNPWNFKGYLGTQ